MNDNAGVNGSIAEFQCLSFILMEKVVDMRTLSEDEVMDEANNPWNILRQGISVRIHHSNSEYFKFHVIYL